MKIAFLSFYSGLVHRGVETFVHELSNHLTELSHEVSIFQNGPELVGSKYSTVSFDLKVDLDHPSSQIPFVNYLARRVKNFTHQVLSQLNQDTQIIIATNGQWQSLLSRIWAQRHGAKLIISGQSGPGLDDRINLWTFPHVFVALTEFQKKWAQQANPFIRVEKIPNGVELKQFKPNVKPLPVDLPKPIILCVSALTSWKRLDLVIKAISLLDRASLLLVGAGEQQSQLQILGDKLLPNRFRILSFPHHQMPSVYKAADLFTYATVPWESFGMALLEAMATNLSIVATDDPIRREVVGDAGLFVNPENASLYAQALNQALSLRWGNKPRAQAEKFSWDIIAGKYDQLFKSLLT